MPSIIKNEEQVKALREIEDGLDTVAQLDQIIAKDGNGIFLGLPQEGKGKSAIHIDIQEKERRLAVNICLKMRERLAKDISAKAEKYKISLDDTDRAILGIKG